MLQSFEYKGSLVRLEWASDGRLVFSDIIETFISKIPCSNIPINIRIPHPENIAYIARLVSTGGQFKLDDFAHNIYPNKIT